MDKKEGFYYLKLFEMFGPEGISNVPSNFFPLRSPAGDSTRMKPYVSFHFFS